MQLASRGRGNLFIYASTIFTILGVPHWLCKSSQNSNCELHSKTMLAKYTYKRNKKNKLNESLSITIKCKITFVL